MNTTGTTTPDATQMIVSISESNQNPIEKLPTRCLPPPLTLHQQQKRAKSSKGSSSKKRPRSDTPQNNINKNNSNGSSNKNDDTHNSNNNPPHPVGGAGLKQAVQELMRNYQGRATTERKPFYCRYCQHQATDYTDFVQHQRRSTHLQNVTLHNQASYCKLCAKQFNSPLQLKEHLTSQPHRHKLQYYQSKQQAPPQESKRRSAPTYSTKITKES